MKRILFRISVAALALAPVRLAHAQAQFTIQVFANEMGKGRITNSGGFDQALTGSMAPDPGPGGLSSALTFDLLGPPGLTSGDVFLMELDEAVPLGDVIRFNQLSPFSGTLVFYSALGGGTLADVGFPTAFYDNAIQLPEVLLGDGNFGIVYTPTAGQPGFVSRAEGPVTYTLESDIVATPEPASLVLLGTGFVGMAGFVRRKRST